MRGAHAACGRTSPGSPTRTTSTASSRAGSAPTTAPTTSACGAVKRRCRPGLVLPLPAGDRACRAVVPERRGTRAKVPRRATARRHLYSRSRPGAARRRDADLRAARARGGARPRRVLATSRSPAAASSTRPYAAGVESPWERIRALKARTKTPLALALRGRFLVGARPVERRRRAPLRRDCGRERHRRVPAARPAERRREPARRGRGDPRRRARVRRGPRSTAANRRDALVDAARAPAGARRDARAAPRSRRAAAAARARASSSRELHELSGLPVGLYCQGAGRQRARGRARGGAARRRPDRVRRLSRSRSRLTASRARPRPRRSSGSGSTPASTRRRSGRRPTSSTSTSATTPVDAASATDRRCAPRGGSSRSPSSPRSTSQLRARNAGGRLDEVLDEVERVRVEAGSPPLAAPIGHIVASQALVNVLGANRYGTIVDELRDLVSGRFGTHAGPDRPGARARRRACAASAPAEDGTSTSTRCATARRGLPRARRSCCCSRSSASRPSGCCSRCASAPAARTRRARAESSRAREERIRAVVRIVQETGIDEITVEEDGMRVSVRRTPELRQRVSTSRRRPAPPRPASWSSPRSRSAATASSASRARWSAPSTAAPAEGEPPFVEEGDPVAEGQTLCILEAMKLMNHGQGRGRGHRAEDPRRQRGAGRVRPAPVRARAAERPPAGDLDVLARPGCEPRRDRGARDPRAPRARRRGGRGLLDRRPRSAARAARRPRRPRRPPVRG